jgi:hypothetical protein
MCNLRICIGLARVKAFKTLLRTVSVFLIAVCLTSSVNPLRYTSTADKVDRGVAYFRTESDGVVSVLKLQANKEEVKLIFSSRPMSTRSYSGF